MTATVRWPEAEKVRPQTIRGRGAARRGRAPQPRGSTASHVAHAHEMPLLAGGSGLPLLPTAAETDAGMKLTSTCARSGGRTACTQTDLSGVTDAASPRSSKGARAQTVRVCICCLRRVHTRQRKAVGAAAMPDRVPTKASGVDRGRATTSARCVPRNACGRRSTVRRTRRGRSSRRARRGGRPGRAVRCPRRFAALRRSGAACYR